MAVGAYLLARVEIVVTCAAAAKLT